MGGRGAVTREYAQVAVAGVETPRGSTVEENVVGTQSFPRLAHGERRSPSHGQNVAFAGLHHHHPAWSHLEIKVRAGVVPGVGKE